MLNGGLFLDLDALSAANKEVLMAANEKVTTYKLKQALAAKVGDHVEIAVEADDGTKFKIVATAEQLDA